MFVKKLQNVLSVSQKGSKREQVSTASPGGARSASCAAVLLTWPRASLHQVEIMKRPGVVQALIGLMEKGPDEGKRLAAYAVEELAGHVDNKAWGSSP